MEPTFKEKTDAMISRLDKIFNLQTIGPSGTGKTRRDRRKDRHRDRGSDSMYSSSDEEDDHNSDIVRGHTACSCAAPASCRHHAVQFRISLVQ